MPTPREELLEQTYAARAACLEKFGALDPDLLTHLVNPSLMGGPRWPDLRQAFRVVRRGGSTIVCSDGLADPFDDVPEPNVGLGIEVLGETSDPVDGPVQNHWLFWVVYDVAQQAAHHGGFCELIDELGLLSMEIKNRYGPDELATPDGTLGVLLGVHPPDFDPNWTFPAGTVKVVTVKVLHPTALNVVVQGGTSGRRRVAELLAGDGSFHVSSALRPLVIE